MSADIEKLAVFDGRIVQSRPKYAVEKGALSVTNAPFSAIAQTTSQHTYNIYVPSENVFVDRALLWTSQCFLSMAATLVADLAPNAPIVVPARDFALCAFPLNSLCSTIAATINDTTAVINTQDVLPQVLRLTDYKKNRLQRTCPTMLDKYANYNDAFLANNNPLSDYTTSTEYAENGNGAFKDLYFTLPNGNLPSTSAPNYTFTVGGNTYTVAFSSDGVPINGGATPIPAGTAIPIYFYFKSTEKIVLSPFVFADEHEQDTGLFGINNIQLVMNIVGGSLVSRIVRSCSRAGVSLSNVGFNPNTNGFSNSRMNVTFLTPSLSCPLPPKSVVPYMEFPRFITSNLPVVPSKQAVQLQSTTITLPSIPDLLIIYVKPQTYGATEGDYMLPVDTTPGSTAPFSLNFDNFSGLLSSMTAEQLYHMSVKNGLDMDWDTWSGYGKSSAASYSYTYGNGAPAVSATVNHTQGGSIALNGGMLVLKPSQDVTLQEGQAPSLVGNFTLQFNLRVYNPTAIDVTPLLYVITANSGFFESVRGSSRILKGVLSEQDVIGSSTANFMVRPYLERLVGGFSFSSLANVLSKAKDIYEKTKPAVSAIKGMLPEGTARDVMGAIGYGTGGGTGGVGAGTGGRKKHSLSSRLM